jgi:hypothetical protein
MKCLSDEVFFESQTKKQQAGFRRRANHQTTGAIRAVDGFPMA